MSAEQMKTWVSLRAHAPVWDFCCLPVDFHVPHWLLRIDLLLFHFSTGSLACLSLAWLRQPQANAAAVHNVARAYTMPISEGRCDVFGTEDPGKPCLGTREASNPCSCPEALTHTGLPLLIPNQDKFPFISSISKTCFLQDSETHLLEVINY